jgi:hypothetical protein
MSATRSVVAGGRQRLLLQPREPALCGMVTLALGLAIALAGPAIAAGEAPGDFAAKAPIELEGDGPYYQLALPFEAHFAAQFPDLRDLRVFNGKGETVPFSVIREPTRSEQTSEQIALPWFPLYAPDTAPDAVPEIRVERRTDGAVVSVTGGGSKSDGGQKLRGYLLDLSQSKSAAHRLALDWDPAMTGFQQVTVEASDDLQNWQTWRTAAQLARLEFNGQHVDRRDIDLPDQHAGYLRLTWRAPAEAPVLTAVTLTAVSASYRPTPVVWSGALPPTRTSDGAYEWDFPRLIAPERLKLGLPETNVLAPAELWGKGDGPPPSAWRLLAGTVVYRLDVAGREWEQDDIALSAPPVRSIKLTLDARGGGLGNGVPTVSLGLAGRQLLFLARGGGPFVLAIGNAKAELADLAPATLIPGYESSAAPPISAARLGALAGIAVPPVPSSASALTPNWKTVTLWAILLTGVAGIGAMALYLLRQMKK